MVHMCYHVHAHEYAGAPHVLSICFSTCLFEYMCTHLLQYMCTPIYVHSIYADGHASFACVSCMRALHVSHVLSHVLEHMCLPLHMHRQTHVEAKRCGGKDKDK